jgi:hypothetical protein
LSDNIKGKNYERLGSLHVKLHTGYDRSYINAINVAGLVTFGE